MAVESLAVPVVLVAVSVGTSRRQPVLVVQAVGAASAMTVRWPLVQAAARKQTSRSR